jgi:hypothetical protein
MFIFINDAVADRFFGGRNVTSCDCPSALTNGHGGKIKQRTLAVYNLQFKCINATTVTND